MEALAVIKDFDVVEESALGLGEVGEGFAFEVQFTFEGGPEAFHGGVVVAATGPAHAGSKAIGEELLLVGGAGVLAAAIGVVEEAGGFVERRPGPGGAREFANDFGVASRRFCG